MYRVKKILSLNNALISVECDPSINFQTSDGTEYARNRFIIEIPRKYMCRTSGEVGLANPLRYFANRLARARGQQNKEIRW